mmetsp:Transcript_29980/g.71414  ORF Transcript_29980/g.71414 Transcript_29980/m.71414 type:complete len:413 (-) Transcript_29980:49-1287(-)
MNASLSFSQYLGAIQKSIELERGDEFRELIDLNNGAAMQAIFEAQQRNPQWDPSGACTSRFASPWDEVVSAHCLCLASLLKGSRVEAYNHLVSCVTPFLKAFRQDTTAWCIEPMYGVVRNVRSVATAADKELKKLGKNQTKLTDAGRMLQNCFSAALQGHGNKAKKLATLEVVNTLFKIYFSLNTLRLCKNLIKSVDSPLLPNFDNFPLAQRVTYRFYVGRLAVFDEDYVRARDFLEFAFDNCEPSATRNKALILKYLIPVQLLLGILPTRELLRRHKLEIFEGIVGAMKTGSIKMYNECMDRYQEVFIQAGTFLLLEKLKQSVYRRLLRKVAAVHKELEPAKWAQIPLALFQSALAWEGCDMDLDEIECILANLVYRKYVKGYISHQHRVLVISKMDAFPPLKNINLVDIN